MFLLFNWVIFSGSSRWKFRGCRWGGLRLDDQDALVGGQEQVQNWSCDHPAFAGETGLGGDAIFGSFYDDEGLNICAIGSKLPIFPYNRGWSSTQVRRVLYTHYKDSLLKVG